MLDLDRWLNAVRSAEAATRLQAVQAAAAGQIVDVAPQVIALLDDPIAEVRAQAATALAQMGLSGEVAQQAITALSQHQRDSEPMVRQAISAALIRLEQAVEVAAESARELEEAFDQAKKADDRGGLLEEGLYGSAGSIAPGASGAASVEADAIEVPVLPMRPFSPPAAEPPDPARSAPPPEAPPIQSASQPAPPLSRNRQAQPTTLEEQALQQEAQEVQFSAYFPREIIPTRWYPLTAYLFKSFAAEQVLADARSTLGAWMAAVRRVISSVRRSIPEGTVITATPYMEGVQFNPPAITFGFYEDWHRLDFRLRTTSAEVYQSVNGRMTFTIEGVIVADVPLSIYVTDSAAGTTNASTTSNSSGTPNNGSDMQTVSQKLYKSIFCSYSRDDKAIVERVERVYRALGFDFLRDVVSLKSGEDWNDKLYDLIEQADIFQLFWSTTAAHSEYVEREWRHALSLDRDGSNFIRPVYWQEPMPPVPTELGEIHFAYEPTLDDNL